MKFTLSWLKDHLETSESIKIICSTLTTIGLEVESIQDRFVELKPFKVAKVTKVAQHPNADRLKVCKVETINGTFQVVCGALNARLGMLGVFAPENSYIPGTQVKLKKSIIRGVESSGMLVSEREMGISDEHEGIIEIDSQYKVGDSFSRVFGLDDPIIEINITPNRPDCLSVRGIARDLAAAGIGELKKRFNIKINSTFNSPIKWLRKFNTNDDYLCPGVAGRYFSNVNNCESPNWLKHRLIAIGLRPISALVDITNYVTIDLGRPLHVYDADKIKGNLTMRLASKNEICKTLDEKEYKLTGEIVVISDEIKLHGIGGVMGGYDSRCTLETKKVFLEVALFDPINVTKTGRKINLQSDARYRFERGVDPNSINWGVDEASKLIIDFCGGEASHITSDVSLDDKKKSINFPTNKVFLIGGINIPISDQIKILKSLGFAIKTINEETINIIVPSFRSDIDGEADIVEEIIRIYGYEKIKPQSVLDNSEKKENVLNHRLKPFYKSKRLLASRGYFETVTWSFMASEIASYFYKEKLTFIKNPISEDLNIMRPTILPNLLSSVSKNVSRLYNNGKVFEVGPQFKGSNEDQQEMVITAIQYGSILPQLWNHDNRPADIFDIKSDVMFVLDQLNISVDKLQHEPVSVSWYHPEKSASLKIGKSNIANYGEIHPLILQIFDIKNVTHGFEIFLNKINKFQNKQSSTKVAYDNNPLQSIERDFAFVFKNDVKSVEILNTVNNIDKQRIKKVTIFDVFQDRKLKENTKSIAFKVILQPIESTFTESEIEKLTTSIIESISTSLDGHLRQ